MDNREWVQRTVMEPNATIARVVDTGHESATSLINLAEVGAEAEAAIAMEAATGAVAAAIARVATEHPRP